MGYLNLVDSFVYGEPVFRAKLDALAENDAYLKDNGWATNTKTVFYQAAVPTGWTKDTSQNDKWLRVVNSTGGGTGGSLAASGTITLAHTAHSIASDGAHTHDISSHYHILTAVSGGYDTALASGRRLAVDDTDSDFLKLGRTDVGSSTIRVARNKLNAVGTVTTGSDGAHDHGGSTATAALADIVLAYIDVLVGTKDTSSGYTDETSEFGTGDVINYNPFDELADNDLYNKDRLMPAGSVMIFGQATASIGWTKLSALNNAGLRVVSGTGGGSGGTHPFGNGITVAHTHTTPSQAGHSHTIPNHVHEMATQSTGSSTYASLPYIQASGGRLVASNIGSSSSLTCYKGVTTSSGSSSTATSSAHTHDVASGGTDLTLAYLDVIQCSKDSTGAPYSYADMTSSFAFKRLVSKQRLNNLAKNDAYVLFHTTPSGTKAFFFMASVPATWTKLTTENDKCLRIVSGSTGGTPGGGAHLMSQAIALAHTHGLAAASHSHTLASHTHILASASLSATPATDQGFSPTTEDAVLELKGGGGSAASVGTSTNAPVGSTDSKSHNHGTATGSLLSNVTLAYIDVLYAQKD